MRKAILTYALLIIFAAVFGLYYYGNSTRPADPQKSIKIEKKTFGYSTQEKAIEGYEIGSGSDTLLLLGALHGDETGTADLLNRLIKEIQDNPNIVSDAKKLIVIPIANPDAYYGQIHKFNANKVNLNLNFATSDWQKYGPEGTYAGSEPFSEAESKAIKSVVEQYEPNAMISYHASGHLVTPEHDDKSVVMGKWYAEKTGYHYYDETNFEWDYPGTATKWFSETTANPAITVELTDYSQSDWDINKRALLELLK